MGDKGGVEANSGGVCLSWKQGGEGGGEGRAPNVPPSVSPSLHPHVSWERIKQGGVEARSSGERGKNFLKVSA